ncbi:MAG: flagellar basal body rod C-terminal domain-containing protein, partial [Candidatus Margulisiibacteriota bacterium]
IGGVFLVSNQDVSKMTTEVDPGNNGYNTVKWENSGLAVKITDGELYGLIKTRDQTLAKYLDKLDTFAGTLISQINDLHSKGYGLNGTTGTKFFSGSDASSIAVNDELMQDSSLLAASSSPESPEGNGENAILIGNNRNKMVLSSNTVTLDQYYQNLVADIGTGSAEAKTYVKTNEALALQIAKEINSVSGVSIDEEMTNMIKAQQAYTAAAKYLTMVQSTMDTLLNLVGR